MPSQKNKSYHSIYIRSKHRGRTRVISRTKKTSKYITSLSKAKAKAKSKAKIKINLYNCSKLKMGPSDNDVLHDIICLKIKENMVKF